MRVERLLKVVHVIRFRTFILEALASIADKVKDDVNEEVTMKTLINLVVDHDRAWLGIVFDEMQDPVSFAVVQDCTPEFDSSRQFVVRWFYHAPSRFDATIELMTAFEGWAKIHGIKRYSVTTRRSNGTAIRCFQSARYGFGKAFLTFEKDL